jgi:hypothetical protein
MTLSELLLKFDSIEQNNSYLYFITRVLKNDYKKHSKVLGKYMFKVYQIDINEDIRQHLFDLTQEQLNTLIHKKVELHDYDVITDDTASLFTYSMTNNAMSFYDVVNNQLKSAPPKVSSLESIIQKEELWAYCVGFQCDENDWIYTFRKILASKVAIDEKDSNSRSKVAKFLRTAFNTKNQKLELIEGETINLDKQIDCIFYIDTFYIAKKTQFEQIIGLEEEFKEQALVVVTELAATGMIEGVEILENEISTNPAIHKKLVRLSKLGNYKSIDAKTIKKMQKVCKKYGDNLKIKDGKLHIEDVSDIELALKMLADYYKQGEVSGKAYGTYAGKELAIVESVN